MISIHPASLVRILVASAVLAPAWCRAQAPEGRRGAFVGVGAGVETIRDAAHSAVSPAFTLRVGYSFSPSAALVVESGVHGLKSDSPAPGPYPQISSTLSTITVLASLQVALPANLYVRPGLGFGRNDFHVYQLDPPDVILTNASHEWGPAAGLALGRRVGFRRLGFDVEAAGLWSHGEDSTRPRWGAALQVVPEIHF